MALTFKNLFPVGEVASWVAITKCQGMLPNRMQCPKAGAWIQIDDSTTPPTETQLCHYHAVLAEIAEKQRLLQTTQDVNTAIQTEQEKLTELQNQVQGDKSNVNTGDSTTDPSA